MDDKQETLEILRNIRDKKMVEQNETIGLCCHFENESVVYLRNVYGVYVLDVDLNLQSVFEQAAQAVLGYGWEALHAFWLLPLGEDGNYNLPTYTCLEGEDGGIIPTSMTDPLTGQSCSEIFIDKPERLTSARLKLLDDMIAYLEKELI